jgi:penicillin-binding protein-related factor A (putative recombinase)
MSGRGKPLESAIGMACVRYSKEGRAQVKKVDAERTNGGRTWSKSNGSDYQGYFGNPPRPIHFECKETSIGNFPINEDKFSTKQREQLQASYDDGVFVGLVIAFTALPVWEVFWLHWPVVAEFLSSPHRASLSQAFCRAYGLLLPLKWSEVPPRKGHERKRYCYFLDGELHPLRSQAFAIVEKEKSRAAQPPLFEAPTPKRRVKPELTRTPDGKLDLIGGMKWGAKARGAK